MNYDERKQKSLDYLRWHRTLGPLSMCDIDSMEYCGRCKCPLAIIETQRDWGQNDKFGASIAPLIHLAQLSNLPLYVVFYDWDRYTQSVRSLRVRGIIPSHFDIHMSPAEYKEWLWDLRRNHDRSCIAK